LTEIIASGQRLREDNISVETVTTLDGIETLGGCYERVLERTGNLLPFALHDWHLAWCRNFLNCDPRIRETPFFCVVRDSAGACVAIVPLIVSRRRVGPFKIVSVNMLGADPAITELRAPMVQPGYEYVAARAVQQRLAAIGDWDWIHWNGISEAFAAALDAAGSLQWQPALPDYVLDMPPTWEEFRAGLKRNIRESLRHCYNSLKRNHHKYELQVIENAAEMRAGLDRFLELHVMRSNLTTNETHPNRFASKVSRDFLYDVCQRLATRGGVRLFELKVNSQIVAIRIGFVVRDSLYLYYSGFDPAWARYSVMTTTMAEAIKYAIAQGIKTVNLSPTKDIAKTRWGPRQIDYRSAYQVSGRLRSRLARWAYLRARSGAGVPSWLLRRLIAARRKWT
jgi:CelD/BcsL family acetyltransferase involved in cellulose biosynthesis